MPQKFFNFYVLTITIGTTINGHTTLKTLILIWWPQLIKVDQGH